ncbi:hypothetical protein RGF97_01830 [Streptomyces roseicoloratus]|uniref:Uncharacterized protein n=1 Tax=Streptomyces roseicoloratus TaxID=2508722 RepID=A0ABY9RQ25_9ACTN|nr:hypothetical protein [Streptomyces roseicoloratus]WMX43853.1 hypothetical protein RGF97_01830 [Streptomyces roseicoloratus]
MTDTPPASAGPPSPPRPPGPRTPPTRTQRLFAALSGILAG